MVDPVATSEQRESIPEPSSKPLLNANEELERGHPGEYLPGRQRDAMVRAAEAYVRDQGNPPDGRERVKRVWLQNQYRPAYQRFTPRPDKDLEPDPFG